MIFVVATLSVAAGQCCECCNKWFGKKVILSINGTLIWCNHRPTSAPTHGTRGLEETRYKYEKYGKPGANGSKAAIISASLTVSLPHVYEQRCDWEVFLSLVLTIAININFCIHFCRGHHGVERAPVWRRWWVAPAVAGCHTGVVTTWSRSSHQRE